MNRLKRQLIVAFPFWLAIAPSTLCGEAQESGAEPILVSMPEPLEGFIVSKQEMVAGDKSIGYAIVVQSETSPAKAVITVETGFDRSTRPARVAATKGYVNGTASTLGRAGFKLEQHAWPDLDKETFGSPIQTELKFVKPDGAQLFVRQIIFFTDKGFHIQIAAPDQESAEPLTQWARHIGPAMSKLPPVGTP